MKLKWIYWVSTGLLAAIALGLLLAFGELENNERDPGYRQTEDS